MHLHRHRHLLASLAALLLASMVLPDLLPTLTAQRARGVSAVRNTVNNNRAPQATRQRSNLQDGNDGFYLANIDESWYLELTPSYVKAGRSLITDYYGATLALGYMLSQETRLQLETGCFISNQYNGNTTYLRDFTYDRKAPGLTDDDREVAYIGRMRIDAQTQAQAYQVPVLLAYSYNIRLDARERLELRLSAAAGVTIMFDNWKVKNGYGQFWDPDGYLLRAAYSPAGAYTADTDPANPASWGGVVTARESFSGSASFQFLYTIGAGFGLTYHFTPRCYVDAGYRFLWMDTAGNNMDAKAGTLWNGTKAWNYMNTHTYSLTLGWKF